MTDSNRDFRIDFLRWIGLTLIVLAHVKAPFGVTQLRSFDVPLMVFVSGLCFKTPKGNIWSYLLKRFRRLYFPTAIFLCFYFLMLYIAKKAGIHIPFDKEDIIGSFLLLEKPSIGYVWIIRVFILMALTVPCTYYFVKSQHAITIWISIVFIYIINNIACKYIYFIQSDILRFIIEEYVLFTFGYGLILTLSLWIKNKANRIIKTFGLIAGLLLLTFFGEMLIEKTIFPISSVYKYPPHSYYILYGLCCCFLLYSLTISWNNKTHKFWHPFIVYISEHSMWIYLWHIPFVTFCNSIHSLDHYWLAKWIFCYIMAIIITFLQVRIINYINDHFFKCKWFKYLIQ